jgi:predicted TIM-barrel fold metal-dependent hydrolase
MRIVDAHVHVIERVAGFGPEGELRPVGRGRARWASGLEIQLIPPELGDRSFPGEALLRLLDAHDVAQAVLLQGSFYGFQNEYTAEVVRLAPARLIGAGTFDPFCAGRDALLARLLGQLAFPAVKLELSSGAGLMGYHPPFAIDGPVLAGPIEQVAAAGATLVLDLGSPGMPSFQPEAVARLARRHPPLRIVLCHLLAPTARDEGPLTAALRLLSADNLWFDLAAVPWNVRPEQFPYPTARRYLALARRLVGSSRLLWGSDAPSAATADTYAHLLQWVVEAAELDGPGLEKVLHGNACEAYPALRKGT